MQTRVSSTTLKTISAVALCGAALAGLAPHASAQLWVYEPFDYTAGTEILGQNGGLGFNGAWRAHAGNAGNVPAGSFVAQSGSLAAPAGLPTSGGHALLTGEFGTLQPARDFGMAIGGADGSSTWISFIGQRQGEALQDVANPYSRGVNTSFFNSEHATQERVGIGNSTGAAVNEWSIVPQGSGNDRVGGGVPYDTLAWVVLRIDHHGDVTLADDAYLWVNPDPLGGEPQIGSANASSIGGFDYSSLDFIRPFVGNTASGRPFGVLIMDELRIGGDWASMTAVPEPATFSLLGIGAGLALIWRRRRH